MRPEDKEKDDSLIRHQMSKLRDDSLDYESIWQKVELETRRRQSKWNPAEEKTIRYKHKWKVVVMGLIGVCCIGIAAIQMGGVPSIMNTVLSTPSVVQKIGATAEDKGIQYTVDTVTFKKYTDQTNYIQLKSSLNGIKRLDFKYAKFKKSVLTDLESGKKFSITADQFTSADGLQASTDIILDNMKPGEHHFRLQLRDLYLIDKKEIPIEGTIAPGKNYKIPVNPPLSIKVKQFDWSNANQKLIFKYVMLPDTPANNTIKLISGSMDEASYVTVKSKDGRPEINSMNAEPDGIRQEFHFSSMTDQQRNQVKLSYMQGSIVQQVSGYWCMDFSITIPEY